MATYNGEKYIKKQIDSILCQLESNDELIISDDGSTDTTVEIIKSYQDNRIKLLFHRRDNCFLTKPAVAFIFAAKNFENSLRYARGDYIFLSDQDDVWEKNKINVMGSLLLYSDLVMCNFSLIDDSDKVLKEAFLNKNPVSKSYFKNLLTTPFLGCTMAFSKKMLNCCLPIPNSAIGHDFWIGCLICAIGGKYTYFENPLHRYRKHGHNVSPGTSGSKNTLLFKITYRIAFTFQILLRMLKIAGKK
jgi:glycosyltransferase involved in cell wall biosynthesis